MADTAAKSGLFPALKSKDQVMTLMLLCQAEGLHPMQALRRYDLIQGRPALKTDAILAEFQARGGTVEWGAHTHDSCTATFAAPGLKAPVTVTWTLDDAKRAGLLGKDTWRGYTRQMLRARTVSEGVRMAMPAVVVGIYTPEETADFDAKPPYEPLKAIEVEVTGELVECRDSKTGEVSMRDKATPAQLERVRALIKDRGLSDAKTEKRLREKFGKSSVDMLGREEADELIAAMEKANAMYGTAAEKDVKKQERGVAVLNELAAEFTPEEMAQMAAKD
jgi:hypothetical protein